MIFVNGFLRTLLQFFFKIMAGWYNVSNAWTRARYQNRFEAFRKKTQLDAFSVSDFESQRERLKSLFESLKGPKYLALTSGTTSTPKEIPYDLRRTKLLQKNFLKSMITLTSHYPGKKTFFVFASLKKDQSLTAGMMEEGSGGSHLEYLQAPYRYLHTKEGQELIEKFGELTARVMVLIITQPRYLYATNPSTLTFFLRELETRWKEVRVRLKRIPPGLLKLSDGDGERRIMSLVINSQAPSLKEILPELKAIITWDGGYVRPFLEQLKAQLPGVDFLPMYSMSTETIETLPHRIGKEIAFVPVIKGVYPEFLDPESGKLFLPSELEAGKTYELIVSDDWGLRRYSTHDLFLVKRMVSGFPDLAFLKRKGITSSLTGEKLTEEQVVELGQVLRTRFPELKRRTFSLFPVKQGENFGYELAVIGNAILPGELSKVSDQELGKINSEYRSKIESGRLRPLRTSMMSEQELAELMGKEHFWESQFKVLPLYEKLIAR